jgi:hypothetical protein
MIVYVETIQFSHEKEGDMHRFGSANNLITISPSLLNRRGKRPITIRGPLHVQCDDYGEDTALRHLLDEVIAWPHIETSPLPIESANLLSLKVGEEVASADPSVFITGREFGRVLFGAPTIYLRLPLSWAHWAIIRGWAEPHFSSSFALVPPGVMVVYTPRDEQEVAVCRSLFWVSYNFSLGERRKNSAKWVQFLGVVHNSNLQEAVAVAQ